MPIIPTVGRKAPGVRLLFTAIYALLTLGAVTMVYPFLLMLATSITSSTDTSEYRVVPRFLHDERALFAKYVDDKYAGEVEAANTLYHTDFKKGEQFAPATNLQDSNLLRAWRSFAASLPVELKYTTFRGYGPHPPQLDRFYREYVRRKFNNDIKALNVAYTEENENFETVKPPIERPSKRAWTADSSRKMTEFLEWEATLSEEYAPVFGVDALFAKYLREDVPAYGGDYRKAAPIWGFKRGFDEVILEATPPADSGRLKDWETFVRTRLPLRYVKLSPAAVDSWHQFLHGRYPVIDALNKAYASRYASIDAIPIPSAIIPGAARAGDWGDYVAKVAPLGMISVDTPENQFRKLMRKNGSEPIRPPFYASDSAYVREHASELRRDYVTRNYRFVLDYILLHGRGVVVTVLFCAAAVATMLVVNPLCAYALSRFQLRYSHRILLFLLATMAFPAEVALIPNFLLLKQLGMLNTYWALILPGAANGFAIFLLKGFFDSLPKELYEAGIIDGASETRMFFQIAIPLSKPIFAVIALQAFTASYGAFMFALLVCQDPKMWTLMVWLYELQTTNPQYIVFAGLTLAALPTLAIFLVAQNVIMRGIILPTEK